MCQLGPGWILILRAILMGAGLVQVRLFLFLGKTRKVGSGSVRWFGFRCRLN